MTPETRIRKWLADDAYRMQALSAAASLGLPDWCLAAGFVRNLVWDRIHGFSKTTALNDIDLIYFDPLDDSERRDRELERQLGRTMAAPWSVKNQARMHRRNGDAPYHSTADAMSYWVEVETSVGAALSDSSEVLLVSPFGFDALFNGTVTLNTKKPKPRAFEDRVVTKQWLETWPKLVVNG